jgi:uncharacterized cofD-like protein
MNIVCIGGGTGLHTLLSGLKEVSHARLAAVVTMMDSGGSTGRLRDEFGYLPPGDVRQSLAALSEASHMVRQLLQHRFVQHGSSLEGHTVGNIMLTALKDIYGDEYTAIEAMEKILRIRGKVYPVTLTNCQLVATLEDGSIVKGETNIDVPKHDPRLRITKLGLEPSAKIFARTAEALEDADYIIIGPGDLYTSIMPNLIVEGMTRTLKQAKRNGARIIFITNVMTKHGESTSFTASDFYNVVQDALDGASIDAVLVNNGKISEEQRRAYAEENSVPVVNDLEEKAVVIVAEDLLNKENFARHHPHKLAVAVQRAITELSHQHRHEVWHDNN